MNKRNLLHSLLYFIFFFTSVAVKGQILFTESFNVILDTTKKIQGSIIPDFKFQTQKEDLLEFENQADITLRFKKKNALTLANKIEISRFGKQTFLSGGYVYAEYRRIIQKKFAPEFFSQVHWAEARGMEFKYAGGIMLRYRFIAKEKIGVFFGIGPFYEYERWNYNSVLDTALIPIPNTSVENELVKLGSYISLKYFPLEKLKFDISLYHQSEFSGIFSYPRLASSSKAEIQLTKHLGLALIYQNIYDYRPVVPIRKLFNRVIFTVTVSF